MQHQGPDLRTEIRRVDDLDRLSPRASGESGRRAVNLLQPEARGRLNGLFVGLFFLGGAAGSAVAGIAWIIGGWPIICAIGAAFGPAALVVDGLATSR